MNVELWTPIQEGRFYYRSAKRENLSIADYCKVKRKEFGYSWMQMNRVRTLMVLAKREERNNAKQTC